MVAVLEEIKLITKQRVERIKNPFNELQDDYTMEKLFCFKRGMIYGIIGEQGEGGELISSLLSGRIPIVNEEIYCDGKLVDNVVLKQLGWYVGKSEYCRGIVKKQISVKKALLYAIKKYKRYQNLNEVIEEFHLSPDKLHYKISNYSGEKWRASLAIGYASRKEIFCFSWMNTACFNSILLSSGVFRFFKKLKEDGAIILLPTSRRENVIGLADEIIEINNPQYKSMISENEYFINNF